MTFADILNLYNEQLKDIEERLVIPLGSEIGTINNLISSTINSGGKRIRPLLLLLTAGLSGYKGDYVTDLGTVIEYFHTASLLHDDVIDMALSRRGKPNANAIYGNNITVLSGDYLYSKAFLKLLDLPGKEYARVLTKAVVSMSEGEIFQLNKTGDLSLTIDEYLRIIYGKTAALFSATCECSALLGDLSPEMYKELRNFGLNVGYAFQLKDDVLDYFGDETVLGKKPGTDFFEKKNTLPVILLLKETEGDEKAFICELFLSGRDANDRMIEFIDIMNKYDIQNKSNAFLKQKVDAAASSLAKFPGSIYKDALSVFLQELNLRIN
ncbi:MAG: polyprenyl synthetase family protein [Deferribacteraceae bacterium]|jgi:octaprenyl-diphosphate synthase|nr:polyprenyl synthetase family protein [Deferribacteraceae bacterium]